MSLFYVESVLAGIPPQVFRDFIEAAGKLDAAGTVKAIRPGVTVTEVMPSCDYLQRLADQLSLVLRMQRDPALVEKFRRRVERRETCDLLGSRFDADPAALTLDELKALAVYYCDDLTGSEGRDWLEAMIEKGRRENGE